MRPRRVSLRAVLVRIRARRRGGTRFRSRASLKGDFKAAKKLNDTLIEAYDHMFIENNPAGVKAFLTELGLIENNLRLPMVPLSEEVYGKVRKYLGK